MSRFTSYDKARDELGRYFELKDESKDTYEQVSVRMEFEVKEVPIPAEVTDLAISYEMASPLSMIAKCMHHNEISAKGLTILAMLIQEQFGMHDGRRPSLGITFMDEQRLTVDIPVKTDNTLAPEHDPAFIKAMVDESELYHKMFKHEGYNDLFRGVTASIEWI